MQAFAVCDHHSKVGRAGRPQTVRKPEVAQLIPDTALEGSKHVHDGSCEGDSDLQLPEPKRDRELEQVAGRESPAAPTSLSILEVWHDDALLAQVDQAVLRLVEKLSRP